MKRIHALGLAVSVLIALALTATVSRATFQFSTARLGWQIGNTTATKDTSSLVGMTTSAVLTATKDTTGWFSTAGYKCDQPGFTAAPIVQVAINSSGTTDSVGYQIQYSTDNDQSYFTTSAQAYLVFGTDNSKLIDVITTAGASNGHKFRLILWANDTGGVVHTYSASALVRGSK